MSYEVIRHGRSRRFCHQFITYHWRQWETFIILSINAAEFSQTKNDTENISSNHSNKIDNNVNSSQLEHGRSWAKLFGNGRTSVKFLPYLPRDASQSRRLVAVPPASHVPSEPFALYFGLTFLSCCSMHSPVPVSPITHNIVPYQ